MRVTTSLSFDIVTIGCLPPAACAMRPLQDSVYPKHKHLPLLKPTSEKLPTSVRRWRLLSRPTLCRSTPITITGVLPFRVCLRFDGAQELRQFSEGLAARRPFTHPW